MRASALLLHFLFIGFTFAIPVDNNVEGEPEIECGHQGIQITFNTRNPFNGRLYVKGRHDEADCLNSQIGRAVTGITLNFDTCGVQRLRSLNPRGIFASTTVVISFHPIFVTKVDRVYHIQCFYMEADKTVAQDIQVSDLTTAFITQLVPMPICRYEILEGGPTGAPVKFAVVGQQVYHSWKCDSETVDTFCAVVHTCTVDDGNGDTVPILNDNGCALDRFLLNNLEYPTDLTAGQEAHVYKYADRSSLFYQCQISITVKEPNTECVRPECAELTRGKRHAIQQKKWNHNAEFSTMDVISQRIETIDAFDLPNETLSIAIKLSGGDLLTSDIYCISAFSSIAAFGILLGLSFGVVLYIISKRH
uniref:ZP domain-containing protein n=1 Tax=Panagrolaimus sp. PS1159 TaxID=55785 RepID=A0AC35FY60_9BILA